MFTLEQAIDDWRRQMLSAGVPASAIEELENHLREDIGQQMQSGASSRDAFLSAAGRLGPGPALNAEFARIRPWFGDGHSTISDRLLGALWATTAAWPFCLFCLFAFRDPAGHFSATGIFFYLFNVGIYGSTIFAGWLLFRGSPAGRWILRTIAMVWFIVCITQIAVGWGPVAWRVWCALWAAISFVTVFWLRRPRAFDPKRCPTIQSLGAVLAVGPIGVSAQLQMYTDQFISIHRHGTHGEIMVHWPVFLMLALHLAGLFCLLKTAPGSPSRR